MSGASDESIADSQRKRYRGARAKVSWSEKLWVDILALVRTGASVHFVSATFGITSARLRNWLEDSEVMREEFMLAEEEGHTRLFVELRQASQGDIKGLQWLLQRRFPEVWKERQTIELVGDEQTEMAAMEKLEALILSTKTELTELTELTDVPEQSPMAGNADPGD